MPLEETSSLLTKEGEDGAGTAENMEYIQMEDAAGGLGTSMQSMGSPGAAPQGGDGPESSLEGDDVPDAERGGGRQRFHLEDLDAAGAVNSILKPVSITMIVVVCLILVLGANKNTNTGFSTIMPYKESSNDSFFEKFGGSILNAIVFVIMIVVATVVIVILFKYRCTKLIYAWLGFSVFILLGFFGGFILYSLLETWSITMDWITFAFVVWNFAVVGALTVIWHAPMIVKQTYLVAVSCIMAWCFTKLPEWTTWSVLAAVALYDICAVLTPRGPLKVLVETAQERDVPIPGLIYESKVIKLGLGDFIFYSVLVGRAAMTDITTAAICYIAVMVGLCITLLLLNIHQKALPALPVSIALGIIAYFMSYYLTTPFAVAISAEAIRT